MSSLASSASCWASWSGLSPSSSYVEYPSSLHQLHFSPTGSSKSTQPLAFALPREPTFSMFPECKVCESCAGGQYGNLANLANHQAGGTLQYHQARRFSPVCGPIFYYVGVVISKGDILGYVAPKSAYKKRSSQID